MSKCSKISVFILTIYLVGFHCTCIYTWEYHVCNRKEVLRDCQRSARVRFDLFKHVVVSYKVEELHESATQIPETAEMNKCTVSWRVWTHNASLIFFDLVSKQIKADLCDMSVTYSLGSSAKYSWEHSGVFCLCCKR